MALLANIFSVKIHQPLYIKRTNQFWRINGENLYYNRLKRQKTYSNTPIVYSKWLPKWSTEQETRVYRIDDNYRKKCKWHKYKLNQNLLSCMLLRNKIIIILWHSLEIFIIKKRQKSLFSRHFCKHCFSSSSLLPAKYLYVSTISVAKHSKKESDYVSSDVSVIKSMIFFNEWKFILAS